MNPEKRDLEVGHKPELIKNPPSTPPPIILPREKFALPPWRRAPRYQGQFSRPPGNLDQNLSQITTSSSSQQTLAAPPASSGPSLLKSPTFPKRPSVLQIPHQAHESKDDPTASDMPPPPRLRHKLHPPAPLAPPIQLQSPREPASSRLRLEYNISPKGQLSPRRREPKKTLPDPGPSFKIYCDTENPDSEDSSELDDKGEKSEEDITESAQGQQKEEDEITTPTSQAETERDDDKENSSFLELGSRVSIPSNNEDDAEETDETEETEEDENEENQTPVRPYNTRSFQR